MMHHQQRGVRVLDNQWQIPRHLFWLQTQPSLIVVAA